MSWTQKALDHFTDTAGTNITAHTPDLGSAWAADSGAAQISVGGDALRITTDGYITNTTTLANDQAVEAKLVASGSIFLLARWNRNTTAPTGYCLEIRDGLSFRLWSFNATGDPRQTLVSSGGTGALNDVGRLEIVGTGLTVLQNGTSIFTATDSNYSSGSCGVYSTSNAATCDDFSSYEQAAGGVTYPQLERTTRGVDRGVCLGGA